MLPPSAFARVLTPHGRLSLAQEDDALPLDAEEAQRLQAAFARGAGHGLLQLGAGEVGTALPAVFSYWREFAARYVTALCTHPDLSAVAPEPKAAPEPLTVAAVPPPPDAELEWLAMSAPPITGAEYLTAQVLRALWRETDQALRLELKEAHCGVQQFLKLRNPARISPGSLGWTWLTPPRQTIPCLQRTPRRSPGARHSHKHAKLRKRAKPNPSRPPHPPGWPEQLWSKKP